MYEGPVLAIMGSQPLTTPQKDALWSALRWFDPSSICLFSRHDDVREIVFSEGHFDVVEFGSSDVEAFVEASDLVIVFESTVFRNALVNAVVSYASRRLWPLRVVQTQGMVRVGANA